jgi:hypothetical protein
MYMLEMNSRRLLDFRKLKTKDPAILCMVETTAVLVIHEMSDLGLRVTCICQVIAIVYIGTTRTDTEDLCTNIANYDIGIYFL